MEILPEEVLFEIFSYLTYRERLAVSQVCERWNKVSSNKNLNVFYVINGEMTTDGIKQMLQDAPHLKFLKLINRVDLNCFLKDVGRYNTQLKILQIVDCCGSKNHKEIISDDLMHVLDKCTLIETLKLERSPVTYESLRFTKCLTNLKNLRKLSLEGDFYVKRQPEFILVDYSYVGREDFLALVRKCRNLESVKFLRPNWDLLDEDIKIISENIGTRLNRLNIDALFLTDLSIDYLTTNNKNLSVLQFQCFNNMTEESIVKFSNLPNLKTLGFFACRTLWCITFFDHVWAKKLIKIDLSMSPIVNDLVLLNLGRKCLALQKLKLCGCANITLQGIEALLRHCNNLRHLNISRSIDIDRFFRLECHLIAQHNKLQEVVYIMKVRVDDATRRSMLNDINYGLEVIHQTKPFFKLVHDIEL